VQPVLYACAARRDRSRQQFLNYISVDVREAEVAALETEGEFRVIQAEQVQQSGVNVVLTGESRSPDQPRGMG
jgi:hypothetical protein